MAGQCELVSVYYKNKISIGLFRQMRSKLSQQIHSSIERSQDETALALRTLNTNIARSNASIPPLVHLVETTSNELTHRMHSSFEQQQQILTTLDQYATDVSKLTREMENIAPTVR